MKFQDIAKQRFNLSKRLADVTGARVVAVGDDWQSIFAFAGSDITLFQKFKELMGDGIELFITHTYRNSQELIDIAGNFIQKNSSQIKKRLISPKKLKDPITIECYDDTINIRKNWVQKIEDTIGNIVNEFGPKSSILLIGRYNFDRDWLIKSEKFNEITKEKIKSVLYPNAEIIFLTVHTSKGLGFDNVIVLNMIEDRYGFPSQIEEDPIMKLVTHQDSSIEFAEERRLLYVAITRTKNRVYLITPLSRPSRFVIELVNDYKIPHDQAMSKEFKVNNIYHVRYADYL
jgi:DNA helicase-4